MSRELYPTDLLKQKFVPIKYLQESHNISPEVAQGLASEGKVMYALMKDPRGNKRIPHVNIEQLLEVLGKESLS